LNFHGARSLVVDRKTGDTPTVFARRAAVSLMGGIQPGVLHSAVHGTNAFSCGLVARMLFAAPPSKRKRWVETDASIATAAYADLIDGLFALEPLATEDGPAPKPYTLDKAAKGVWVEFYEENAAAMLERSEFERSAYAKLEGYAARFALIFAAVRETVTQGAVFDGVVNADEMSRAVELARWFRGGVTDLYAGLRVPEDTLQVLDYISRRGGAVTVRDLQRGPKQFRGDSTLAEAFLEDLVRDGWGTWVVTPPSRKGGPPARTFRLADQTLLTAEPGTS